MDKEYLSEIATEDEFITNYLINKHKAKIEDSTMYIKQQQELCKHRLVIKKHSRVDGDGSPEFYTHFSCKICDKKWTEEGSK